MPLQTMLYSRNDVITWYWRGPHFWCKPTLYFPYGDTNMSERKPWRPRMNSDPEFNPFSNATAQRGLFGDHLTFEETEENIAPPQSSHEPSDQDSLDVGTADEHKH